MENTITAAAGSEAKLVNGGTVQQQRQQEEDEADQCLQNADDQRQDIATISNETPSTNNNSAVMTTLETHNDLNVTATITTAAAAAAPPPLLKGTLSYNLQSRRHILRGMWTYEASTDYSPQRFELIRNLAPDEDPTILPKDGEFHGSFSLSYFVITTKGKKKERSKVISETGVKITFQPMDEGKHDPTGDTDGVFKVQGMGTNQFGVFHITGKAMKSDMEGDPTLHVELRKKYVAVPSLTTTANANISTSTTSRTQSNSNLQSTLESYTHSALSNVPLDHQSTANTNEPETNGKHIMIKKRKVTDALYTNTTMVASSSPVPDPTTHSHVDPLQHQRSHDTGNDTMSDQPLPPPSQTYESDVVCLRGKLTRDAYESDGVIHKISGFWASGLNFIVQDSDNSLGLCNKFEYEHKSTVPTDSFPLSGKYMGWFNLTLENGSRTRIVERDVLLKFRINNAGYFNIEGKGSNVFGKYTITGTLNQDHIITIFRHFQPIKVKSMTHPPPAVADGDTATTNASHANPHDSKLFSTITNNVSNQQHSATIAHKPGDGQGTETNELSYKLIHLDDVQVPMEDPTTLAPIDPPLHGLYSAVSRGVLRSNEDGAHTCSGKWATTREHYNQNISSNFHFGLEAEHVILAGKQMKLDQGSRTVTTDNNHNFESSTVHAESTPFPVDSAFYKGSFKIRRGTTKFQTVVDRQIVLRFRKNNAGSYNVYGKGVNDIGTFDLVGTLILSGRASGHVELYRMYPIQPPPTTSALTLSTNQDLTASTVTNLIHTQKKTKILDREEKGLASGGNIANNISSSLPQNLSLAPPLLMRRESSRLIKVPVRLEDDDPQSQVTRIMEKCSSLLKVMRDKDSVSGSFFAVPVDPVALNLPTYNQIIKQPMDLGTIQSKLEASTIASPEQFASLVRLVFENAIKFNDDPTHVVNITARNMLSLFNSKYSEIQRVIDSIQRDKKSGKIDSKSSKLFKDEKKPRRRPESEDPKITALKQLRLSADEANGVLDTFSSPHSSLDHSMLIQMFRLLQTQTNSIQQYLIALQSEKSSSSYLNTQDMGTTASVSSSVLNKSFESYVERKPVKKSKKRPNSDYDIVATVSSTNVMKTAPPTSRPVRDVVVHMDSEPLTLEEQQELTETINTMSLDKLKPVVDIIRESAGLNDDDTEEIELDINQLDTATQRKLQRYVMKVRQHMMFYFTSLSGTFDIILDRLYGILLETIECQVEKD